MVRLRTMHAVGVLVVLLMVCCLLAPKAGAAPGGAFGAPCGGAGGP